MSIIPNSTQTPNLYFDKLMGLLTEEELKTLLYAVRRTMGFSHDVGPKRISLSQFQNGNGIVDEKGNPVEIGTRLSRDKQVRAVKSLTRFRVLVQVRANDRRRNEGAEWAVQLDSTKIDWEGLWQREEKRSEKGRRKSAKARKAALLVTRSDSQTTPQSDPQTSTRSDSQTTPQSDPQTEVGLTVRLTRKKERNQERKQVERECEVTDWDEGDEGLEWTWGMLVEFCKGNRDTAAVVWQLQEYFEEVSGVDRPDIDTGEGREELRDSWWPGLLKAWKRAGCDLEQAKIAAKIAVEKMQEWEMSSVSSPRSIEKKVIGVLAGMKKGDGDGLIVNGGVPTVLPKGADGLVRYMQRRQG